MKRLRVKSVPFAPAAWLAVGLALCWFAVPAAAQNASRNAGRGVPGFAAQGSKIAFTADREGRDAPDEIYVANADGTEERRVTPLTHSCNAVFPRWSPNGHQIAFHCFTATASDIFFINQDGTEMTQLTHMTEAGLGAAFASWSPDGKKIAFHSVITPNIFVINVDGTGLTQLTHDQGTLPAWSPNGSKIAFNSNRDGTTQIYVMEVDDPDNPVRLTTNPPDKPNAANVSPRWSPDGRKITFESTRDGNREIYVMNADGTDQVRLTNFPGIDAFPSWSPNGRWIIFHRQLFIIPGLNAPNGSDVFIVAPDGSLEMQVTQGAPDSFSAFASWAQGHARLSPAP